MFEESPPPLFNPTLFPLSRNPRTKPYLWCLPSQPRTNMPYFGAPIRLSKLDHIHTTRTPSIQYHLLLAHLIFLSFVKLRDSHE
ncbi:hypothetical protein CDAR_538641 [Caerostris darwini]|uniref:Uncharacterized protein n=1 Tax=Caerostris darwini TaxID=1538125 RepID=A0AAV4TC04_9ARAC|nr:hypothetical protein CDAR_538641 [Caerostris darwini]